MGYKSGTRARIAKVLLIDDDVAVLDSMARLLALEHHVECETDASLALHRLRSGERFDVILCDIQMPGMSGRHFHAALQATAPETAARIVFMTGAPDVPSTREFLDSIPNVYVEKPFDLESLFALMDRRARTAARPQ